MKADRLLAGLLVLAACALVWSVRDRLGHLPDEGVVAFGAERVLSGEVPYRDFWTYLPPGAFYLYAGLYRLGGVSLAVARAGAAAIAIGLAVVLYRLGRRFLGPLDAGLFASAYALVTLPVFPIATHHWPSTLAALVAAGAVLDGRWAWAGASTGLAISLHHAKGLLLLGGIAAAGAVRFGRLTRPSRRTAARFAAGLVAGLAPTIVALAAGGAVGDAVDQMVLHLPDRSAQWFPYYGDAGGPLWPRLGSALVAYGTPLGLVAALWRFVRRGPDGDRLGPAALLGAALWASSLYRPDASHVHFVAPLGALVAYRVAVDVPLLRPAARAATAYAAIVAACLTAWAAAREAPHETRRGALRAHPRDPARAWTEAIERRVGPGEPTFVFPYASGLYFHAGVRNATSFEQMKPIVQNAPREVARARAELAAARPRYVFDQWDLYRRTYRGAFPAAPRRAFGPNPFGEILAEGYLPETAVAGMVVWRRRDAPETPPVE